MDEGTKRPVTSSGEDALLIKAFQKGDQRTIRLSKIQVVGGLKEEMARSAVMKEMDAINRCFKRTGIEKSSLQGELTFILLVASDGRVREAQVAKRSAATEELSRCILEILRAIRFHADSKRQDVTVKLTFSVG